jgi:hypothetical protein
VCVCVCNIMRRRGCVSVPMVGFLDHTPGRGRRGLCAALAAAPTHLSSAEQKAWNVMTLSLPRMPGPTRRSRRSASSLAALPGARPGRGRGAGTGWAAGQALRDRSALFSIKAAAFSQGAGDGGLRKQGTGSLPPPLPRHTPLQSKFSPANTHDPDPRPASDLVCEGDGEDIERGGAAA